MCTYSWIRLGTVVIWESKSFFQLDSEYEPEFVFLYIALEQNDKDYHHYHCRHHYHHYYHNYLSNTWCARYSTKFFSTLFFSNPQSTFEVLWSQEGWFLQIHPSFSRLLWLFRVFDVSIWIDKFFKINWFFNQRIIALQSFVVFCQTSTWIFH